VKALSKRYNLITAADISKDNTKFEKKMAAQLSIEGEYIVFHKHHYDIELSRCRTKSAILQWVHHLSGKAWMTTDLIERFIELTTKYHKIDIYKQNY
jgi:hypothetical protein